MIVRILGDNQYRLEERHLQQLAVLDNRLLEAVHADDHVHFAALLRQVVQFIREQGQPLANDELVASDLLVPAPDMTLHEAKRYLEQPIS
jgi:hypothetical protein